jgi:hypothetical protein
MNFAHLPDGAGPNHFAQFADAFAGVALVAHLRGDAMFARGQGQLARFPHRVRQRLFDINVFARPNGPDRRRRVVMIGHRDGHRVNGFSFSSMTR